MSCLSGSIFDVAVDVRRNSPTFLAWHGAVLSADNRSSLLIPEGFAHGFQTLVDDCELLYVHTAAYEPAAERGHSSARPAGRSRLAAYRRQPVGPRWRPPGPQPRIRGYRRMNCRHCGAEATLQLVDLGSAPPSNAYLTRDALRAPEAWYPLRVLVCEGCWLAQTEDFVDAGELFSADYAYFSAYSASWLAHAEQYVTDMVARFGLDGGSHVVEVAANDGYLLQYVAARGIPCTGIEPSASTAAAARERGIPIVEAFFGSALAEGLAAEGRHADLMTANNVLAHVPDINDFVRGFAILLKPDGVATFEFHHLKQLVDHASSTRSTTSISRTCPSPRSRPSSKPPA